VTTLGKTLLVMGDSVMEQFYNTLQCLAAKESLKVRHMTYWYSAVSFPRPLPSHCCEQVPNPYCDLTAYAEIACADDTSRHDTFTR